MFICLSVLSLWVDYMPSVYSWSHSNSSVVEAPTQKRPKKCQKIKKNLTLNPCPNNVIARHCKTVVNNCLRCFREHFPTFKMNIPRNKK